MLFMLESQGWEGIEEVADEWLPCLNKPVDLDEALKQLESLIRFDVSTNVSYPYRIVEVNNG